MAMPRIPTREDLKQKARLEAVKKVLSEWLKDQHPHIDKRHLQPHLKRILSTKSLDEAFHFLPSFLIEKVERKISKLPLENDRLIVPKPTYEEIKQDLQTMEDVKKGEDQDHGRNGGLKSGEIKKIKASELYQQWQSEAEKLWQKNTHLKKTDVAKSIAKKLGGNAEWIRQNIVKPTRVS
jgi:hypothetical protein